MTDTDMLHGARLSEAIADLKSSTRVTMETVGIRCQRRVSTATYKQGLPKLKGPVVLQPPSEDRVSIFVSLVGAKSAVLKMFSTGKVRCLRSDFHTVEDARACAQSIIDRMANTPDAGMPPIRLSEAKFHANFKDLTWSTRQTTDIRKLSRALAEAGFRAESDTSFGDSVMVVVTPEGSERAIKGQVLADGTIRLAGCRDDGDVVGRAVAESLNETGCLQGPPLDVSALRYEVWLTKRNFQLCGAGRVLDIDALRPLLESAERAPAAHPRLAALLAARGADAHTFAFVRFVNKVGTASPRLEVKFAPLVVEEWEAVRRKPEPVSVSIHHRGEVQLAGNAEYKLAQALWFITHLVESNAATLIVPAAAKAPARGPSSASLLSPPAPGARGGGKRKAAAAALASVALSFADGEHEASARDPPHPTPPTAKRARGGAPGAPLSFACAAACAPQPQPRWEDAAAPAAAPALAPLGVWAAAAARGSACPAEALMAARQEASAFHARQLLCLGVLQMLAAGAHLPAPWLSSAVGAVPPFCFMPPAAAAAAAAAGATAAAASAAPQPAGAAAGDAGAEDVATAESGGEDLRTKSAQAAAAAAGSPAPASPGSPPADDGAAGVAPGSAACGRETPLSPKAPQRTRAASAPRAPELAPPPALAGKALFDGAAAGGAATLALPAARALPGGLAAAVGAAPE